MRIPRKLKKKLSNPIKIKVAGVDISTCSGKSLRAIKRIVFDIKEKRNPEFSKSIWIEL